MEGEVTLIRQGQDFLFFAHKRLIYLFICIH